MKPSCLAVLVMLGLAACGDSTHRPEAPPTDPVSVPEPTSMRPDVSPEDLAALRAREAPRAARALAEVERRFASRTPGLSFRVRRVLTTSLGDTHVWLQQVFRGTPVVDRDLGVIISVDDTLQLLGEPDDFSGVAPSRWSAQAALERAKAHGASKGLAVEDGNDSVLEPVYARRLRPGASGENAADFDTAVVGFERGAQVKLRAPSSPDQPSELFVRERDGAVLERGRWRAASGMKPATLRSAFAGTVSLPTYQNSYGVYFLQSERYDFVSASGQRGGAAGFDYQSKLNDWGDNQLYAFGGTARTNGQTAAVDAYISLFGVNRVFADVYGRNGWDDQGGALQAVVHYPYDNAYAPGGGRVLLGYIPDSSAPNGLSGTPLTDIEIVGHEVSHMTFEAMTGRVTHTVGELGGLDEGSADIFGLIAGFYLPDALASRCTTLLCGTGTRRPITVRGDWVQGNWGDARYGRSFIDPPLYPAWEPSITNAEGHYAAGPLARMFYFLSVGVLPQGTAPTPGLLQPQRASVYLPEGLTGLGIDVANRLWYTTLQGVYFSQVTGYHTAREAMLQATTSLYQSRPYTPEYKAVEDAWAAVNVGSKADRTPPKVSVFTSQASSTVATVTVDVADANGLATSTVTLSSAVTKQVVATYSCFGHCEFIIDPRDYGTHTGHTVRVVARDTRENEVSRQVSFSLDVAKPSVSITSNTTTPWPSNLPQQDLRFSGGDPGGIQSAKVLIDGVEVVSQTWNPPTPSFSFDNVLLDVSLAAEGTYPARFEATDRYGNVWEDTYPLLVDRTPPELCTQTVTVDPARNGKVYVTTTGRDDGSGLSLLSISRVSWGWMASDTTKVGAGVQHSVSHTASLPTGTYQISGTCMDQRSNVFTVPPKTINVVVACNNTTVAGGAQVDERSFQMGKASGTVTLSYQTYGVHDRIKVYSGTTLVADTGCVATGDSAIARKSFAYSGTVGMLKVRVEPNCNPYTALPSTEWAYTLSCP